MIVDARPLRTALAVVLVLVSGACGGATTEGTAAPAATHPPVVRVAPEAVSAAAGAAISGAAGAGSPADRLDPPLTACQRIAAAIDARHPGHDLQVIVRTDDAIATDAVVEVARRAGEYWTCGAPMSARIGRSGFRVLADRRSGDGTTPAGVFPLATMTAPDGQRFSFFGNAPDPGVTAGTYRAVRTGDRFGATPNTPGYGHLRSDTACAGADDEYLPRFVRTYTTAALIGANMEPDVSGDAPGEVPYAAAIFLHHHNYVSGTSGATRPTSGCVSLAQTDLTSVLLALTPTSVFSMGTTAYLLAGA